MGYCRFQNTVSDLADCQDALSKISNIDELGTEGERRAARRLLKICRELASDWDEDA